MTPSQSYAAIKLSEEAGEIVQAKSKLDLWGLASYRPSDPAKTTNRTLLARECGDILAAIDYAVEVGLIDVVTLARQRDTKIVKLRREGGERS